MRTIQNQWQDVWRTWWRKQSPVRQDRFAMLAPMVTVLLFLLVVFLTVGYLRFEEAAREQESIKRDMDYTLMQLKERLQERKEQLLQIAKDAGRGLIDDAEFLNQAEALASTSPELMTMVWVDGKERLHSAYITTSAYTMEWAKNNDLSAHPESDKLFQSVKVTKQPLYSEPYKSSSNHALIQLQVPVLSPDHSRFYGVLLSEISLDGLLQHGVPADISKRYAHAFVGARDQALAGKLTRKATLVDDSLAWLTGLGGLHQIQSDLNLNGIPNQSKENSNALQLVLHGYRISQDFTGAALRILVIALSSLIIWMLLANWRHTRKRLKAQDALIAETNFRRAMENSMPTGMRALDLEGRITYVNAAFCQMTGWNEAELVGIMPPYPYWPHEEIEKMQEILKQELRGDSNPGGLELQVLRRNGSRFFARMYLSPLIDSRGKQTGWMASMTDITEPKRVREELSASYERFTTILEGMDASISVSTLGSKQLLFANKTYRDWFGVDTLAQPEFIDTLLAEDDLNDVDALVGLPLNEVEDAPSESKEVFVESLDRWLEVRVRYLNWVDGHLAQMVIASDITARRRAEQLAAEQAERAQTASRLITMGEMASSVAHELNQPLAAIANYCSGMSTRIQNKQIETAELLQALEKTSKQAQRAGQIIQRIRSFVTRSAPNRSASDVNNMITEALELVGIEAKRRRIVVTHHVAARLPSILVDPILIEQVIINLIKNAAEAIDQANRPPNQRLIELKVLPKTTSFNGGVPQEGIEFSVRDTGLGVPPEVLDKVFDAFFSTKLDGMGIGLNLCRSIVEFHQGRLMAENLYNGSIVSGCRFSFWLPLRPLSIVSS